MNSFFERIASHVVFFSIFLALLLNVNEFLNIPLTKFILPLAYVSYIAILIIVSLIRKHPIELKYCIAVVAIPALFLVGTALLAHTYDFTVDGQDYQQTAVISLANGWNPVKDSQLVVPGAPGGQYGGPYTVGYPKTLWLIQAAIYKTIGYINSATITNWIVGLVAFVFCYYLLLRLKISKFWSGFIALFAVLEPHAVQEALSFMSDGFGYEVSLIALVGLISLVVDEEKTLPLALVISSWILLMGTKYTNAYTALAIAFICMIILIRLCLLSRELIKPTLIILLAGAGIAALILFSPYVVNLYRFGSAIYPANEGWAKQQVTLQNIPLNLYNANKFELLFYGIYSQTQIASDYSSPDNVATLKMPFTVSNGEFANMSMEQPALRVATGGVFFSGIFTLSLIIFYFLFVSSPTLREEKIIGLGVLFTILSILCALALPTPNVLRYTPQITLVPIVALVCLLLANQIRNSKFLHALVAILATLILINTIIVVVINVKANSVWTATVNEQLATMRDSGLVYNVFAQGFYSSYIRLQEAGIKFNKTDDLGCKNPQTLDYTYASLATLFCPQS